MPSLGLGNSLDAGSVQAGLTNSYSINFDGTNDYVQFGDVAFSGAFTVSAWIKLDGLVTETLLGDSDDSDWIRFDDADDITIEIAGNPITVTNAGSFATGAWFHFAAVRNASNVITFYKNGSALSTTGTRSGTFTPERIGQKTGSATLLDGNVDELALWNAELNAATISSIYNSGNPNDLTNSNSYITGGGADKTANLKAYWRFENPTFPCIPDVRKTFFTTKSTEFDGVNDYIRAQPSTRIDNIFASGGTVSMWIYLNPTAAGSTNGGLVQKTGDGTYGWNIFLETYSAPNYTLRFSQAWDNEDLIQTKAAAISVEAWHHLVITYDASDKANRAIAYLNSSAISSFDVVSSSYDASDSTAYTTDAAQQLEVGRVNSSGTYQNFRISDLAMWNAVLDADTVASIYNSAEPNDLLLAASYTAGSGVDKTANLRGYWRFGDGVDAASKSACNLFGGGIADHRSDGGGAHVQSGGWVLDMSDITYSANLLTADITDASEWSIAGGSTNTLTNDSDGNLVLTNVDEDDGISARGIAGKNFNSGDFSSLPTFKEYNKVTITCKTSSGSAYWGFHTQDYNDGYGTFSNQDFEDIVIFWRRDHGDANYIAVSGTTAGQTVTVKAMTIEPCDGNPFNVISGASNAEHEFAPNRNSGKMINMYAADIETEAP